MIAFTAIERVLRQVTQQHKSLTPCLTQQKLSATDKMICYGVIRWYSQLEAIANQLLHKPLKAKDLTVKLYLLIGLFLIEHSQMAPHAVVNDVVNAIKKSKFSWARGLLNKLLRHYSDNQDKIKQAIEKEAVSRYAHPQWLIDAIDNPEILDINNTQAPMTLRVNRQQISCEDYLKKLEQQNIKAHVLDSSATAIQLDQAINVESLPGFHDGLCSVQDEAGQLIAAALNLAPGQRVLDACCAPGSKTGHILESQPDIAALVAIDIDGERLKRVNDNLNRLKLNTTHTKLIACDAVNVKQWWDGQAFDRILVDAPCSATGVIRRHPDIKLLRRESDIANFQKQQLALLKALWPLLKEGGQLVYSTCSILKEENEETVTQFLEQHDGKTNQQVQLYPSLNGCDGFHISSITKS